LEKTFNFYTFASNYQSVVLKTKELKKYFCIEGALYKMNKANYKKLCQKWPRKAIGGSVIKDEYNPESGCEKYELDELHPEFEKNSTSTYSDCLNWIVENSTLIIESVEVLNY